jgi:hypothetical protein
MKRAEIQAHWAYKELLRKLEEQDKPQRPPGQLGGPFPIPEEGTLFLFDPEVRLELDETITEKLWPQVLRGLEGARIQIYQEDAILADIKDKRWPEATRQLTFLLEDPAKPVSAGRQTIWYVRGMIESRLLSYMLSFDLMLFLPMEVNLGRISLLLSDERLISPPTLSVDGNTYSLNFSWGRGGGYWNEKIAPEKLIADSILKHLQIIEAAEQLEYDPADLELFDKLTTAVINMYGVE